MTDEDRPLQESIERELANFDGKPVSRATERHVLGSRDPNLYAAAAVSHGVSAEFLEALHGVVDDAGTQRMIEGNPRAPLHLMGRLPVSLHSDYGLQEYCRRHVVPGGSNQERMRALFALRFENRPLGEVWREVVDRESAES